MISNLGETGKIKGTSESGQIGTGQNMSWCKHLGEDAVCVPTSVMSDLIGKINMLIETVSKQKADLLDMEVRLKHELKVRESRLANLIESTSRAKQNESSVSQPAQTGVRSKKKKKAKTAKT